ncbi:MAG: tRNA pseudouridine(55) synthase TruB [Rickettsiales bacterium]|nr:tRNA pseudouridine(55) synthase TruB [Rickettsiales bacterium]
MILNVYKPIGFTSSDVVKKIKNILNVKVGHGGTLDPFAEGVLIVGTGPDTKRLAEFSSKDKTYIATLVLGKTTDTLDPEGEVSIIKKIPNLSELKIKKIMKKFLGEIYQTPPMYSAKKINGVRLYKLARKNITIERKPIIVKILSLELLSYDKPELKFKVSCSKGTYIRTLGHDIAQKLGTVGYLNKLVRTNIGDCDIKDSLKIEEIKIKC